MADPPGGTSPASGGPSRLRGTVPWVLAALFNHRAVATEAAGRTVFVFAGHGSRWADMAKEILGSAPAFAAEMRRCDIAFSEHFDRSLLDVIRNDSVPRCRDGIDVVQPISFAVMASLAAQWRALGIHPDAVLGHSHGEIAAAYVAGGLSLRDAAAVVVQRAVAVGSLAKTGGMAAIAWPVDRVLARIERWGHSIFVAAYNGPSSTLVTGAAVAVDELIAALARDDVPVARVPVAYALHSAAIDELQATLRESLSDLQPRAAEVPFISSVTGAGLDTSILDGDYWFANLRQPVLFEQAIRWSYEHGYHTFIEASPEPVLTAGIQDSLNGYSARTHA
ncbi:acyltransferase domain-containing protein [Mycobacterium sp. ITM-2016-00318]|uniref:acyltransferase domain-containing protein n=1 Tax=Mycobacterium sp. ITM-2016-00318 TaxID=2099693 RepID=UPI00287FCF2E|nr:acyltransferase domain-containing protein [Mycobacterium sp. ITM-2016-00318]WNG92194.1 acyltransferase domain-containing protein [Mycobacterium sp. ITM-2016-00318]